MKRVLLFVILGSLAMTSVAQENYAGPSVEVRGSLFKVPARAYPMFASEVNAYTGTYELSNGEVMHVRRSGKRLIAEVGKRPAQQLVAASPNEFVALDEKLRITFNEGDYGSMNSELLMVVPRSIAGSGSGQQVKLIGSR